MNKRLRGADVLFDARKTSLGIELTGSENGHAIFRACIPQKSTTFNEFSQGPFYSIKVENGVLWGYITEEGETLEVLVKPNGDMTLSKCVRSDVGHYKRKTYAFQIYGTFENIGNVAFDDIVISAQQFHNHGTFLSKHCTLAQHYLFNSGIMQFGNIPKEVIELRSNFDPSVLQYAQAQYKNNTVHNSGTILSYGKVQIIRLDYTENGLSNFEDLQMFGGSICVGSAIPPEPTSTESSPSPEASLPPESPEVVRGQMIVRNELSGYVRNISVFDGSYLVARHLSLSCPVRNCCLGADAQVHLQQSFGLTVSELFENKGVLSSSGKIDLFISSDTEYFGLILAKEKVEVSFKKLCPVEQTSSTVETKKTQQGDIMSERIMVHIDEYTNTVTNTEYIFKQRKTRVNQLGKNLPSKVQQELQKRDDLLISCICSMERFVNQMLSEQEAIARLEREYNRDVLRILLRCGAARIDIVKIWQNTLRRVLSIEKRTVAAIQDKYDVSVATKILDHEHPKIGILLEYSMHIRKSISRDAQLPGAQKLSDTARIFVNDVVVPVVVIATAMKKDALCGASDYWVALANYMVSQTSVIKKASEEFGASETYETVCVDAHNLCYYR
ncbi:MAG: hypothetical protein LBR89_00115 [Holosporales bacterium]|nr:hypothetical protein [Holosporales bacterium]